MEFTSFVYALFLALAFALYWSVARWGARAQNMVLLLVSAIFYAWADPRFLGLLLLSGAVNYALAIGIAGARGERAKSILFFLGIAIDLGLLCWFKYFDFFYGSAVDLLNTIGFQGTHSTLALALPLGISFYTFQMLGYLIDTRNEEIEPCEDPWHFVTYVLYFPKIMAGPIERAQVFLPQIAVARTFDSALATDGMRQILWGLLAKVVVADNASAFVDLIFKDPAAETGSTLLVGAFLYFIQIYFDFSGYSNIAIGSSKLLGIRLTTNFRTPFFATGVNDFWKRWHISLTTWMIDHLFTPLSFLLRDRGRAGTVISFTTTFLAVGIWHGANWTFVAFGTLQSLYFLPLALSGPGKKTSAFPTGDRIPSPRHFARMLGTFLLMMLSFVLLRVTSIGDAVTYYLGLFDPSLFSNPTVFPSMVVLLALLLMLAEWFQRGMTHALERIEAAMPGWIRWTIYMIILYTIILLNHTGHYRFIYFQF
ncbi:MAG: MBOAT family protein [Flavobacteriales bacterium]|nr:MBOAT family protein [Flavobacteriales bacterium]